MKRILQRYPLATALAIVACYVVILAAPAIRSATVFGGDPEMVPTRMPLSQLRLEIILTVSVIAFVAYLGWARAARLVSKPSWGGLWYALVPALITLLIFAASVNAALANGFDVFAVLYSDLLVQLIPLVLLVGIYEEVLFRGILFHGLETRIGPVAGLFASSFIFGITHYVNWINGQDLAATHQQVLHASLAGILYGAIALRTNSVWPGAALHALWDLVATLNGAFTGGMFEAALSSSDGDPSNPVFGFLLRNFEPLIGLVVLAAWYRWHSKAKVVDARQVG